MACATNIAPAELAHLPYLCCPQCLGHTHFVAGGGGR